MHTSSPWPILPINVLDHAVVGSRSGTLRHQHSLSIQAVTKCPCMSLYQNWYLKSLANDAITVGFGPYIWITGKITDYQEDHSKQVGLQVWVWMHKKCTFPNWTWDHWCGHVVLSIFSMNWMTSSPSSLYRYWMHTISERVDRTVLIITSLLFWLVIR